MGSLSLLASLPVLFALQGGISEYIEWLDKEAVALIEQRVSVRLPQQGSHTQCHYDGTSLNIEMMLLFLMHGGGRYTSPGGILYYLTTVLLEYNSCYLSTPYQRMVTVILSSLILLSILVSTLGTFTRTMQPS